MAGKPISRFSCCFRRPNATHFEVTSQSQRSERIFDGTSGWNLRPTSQGLPEVQEYSPEEIAYAQETSSLDSPLFDAKARGIAVSLTGTGAVEGHPAYRLRLSFPSGQVRTDWIDMHSFLELRFDRMTPAPLSGGVAASVYYHNYKTIDGLTLPLVIGSVGEAGGRMVIEKIAINPALPADAFSRPEAVRRRHNGILINTLPRKVD